MVPLGALLLVAVAASPAGLAELKTSVDQASQVRLVGEGGEANVAAVRRRLGALAALTVAARPLLRGADLPARLEAHLAIGEAHEAFARELFAAKAPAAAAGPATRAAWTEQVAATVERALETARAHLRSCVDLAGASGELADRCGKALSRVGAGRRPPRGDPSGIAAARMRELQACLDSHGEDGPEQRTVELTARLSIDGMGRVEAVSLSPRGEQAAAWYDCLSDGLRIWTFPGVADVELELPIRLKGNP